MRDVVIIGGGLSGLSAAYELQQAGAACTLIEVKRRLGGGIQSVQQDAFTLDAGPFALADTLDAAWLAQLGLQDALHPLAQGVAFNAGTGALINALAERLHAPRMMRMAVSSIGEVADLPGKIALCLENGLLLDARAVILAAPARYAERMLYNLRPGVAQALRRFHYDHIVRVGLGYHSADVPAAIELPAHLSYVFLHRSTHPQRTPPDCTVLQVGVRLKAAENPTPEALIEGICRQFDLPQPLTQRVDVWPEADPLAIHDDDHAARMAHLRAQLPPNVALIGSDYSTQVPPRKGLVDLAVRVQQGRQAARQMLD